MCRLTPWHSSDSKAPPPALIIRENHTQEKRMNGWANWETWCASLWIGNEEHLYRLARIYGHSGYDALVPVLETFGETNGDGLRWDDPAIDRDEMDEMLAEL